MADRSGGYSGKPLPDKLGLNDGMDVGFVNLPEDLQFLTKSRAFASVTELGWNEVDRGRGFDFVHLFTKHRQDLVTCSQWIKDWIFPAGMVWVSWPKRASKVETDVTEDTVREVLLPTGLVDIKVCSVSDIWSGLKLVVRKELRSA